MWQGRCRLGVYMLYSRYQRTLVQGERESRSERASALCVFELASSGLLLASPMHSCCCACATKAQDEK